MKKVLSIVAGALVMVGFIGCSTNVTENIDPISVSGITRVLMHRPGEFTFLVEHNDSKKIGQLTVVTRRENTVIMRDLEDGQSIRVEYSCFGELQNYAYQCKSIPLNFSNWSIRASKLIIHLNSVKEIGGAGWHHGGSIIGDCIKGQTTIVQ